MSDNELVPMAEGLTLVAKTIIAVDVLNPEDGGDEQSTTRFAGGVVSVDTENEILYLENPDDPNHVREIFIPDIVAGWWAPAGYRP